MIDTNKLRGIISERGYSQRRLAAELGMTEKTFYSKMKRGEFGSAEMSAMIEKLDIKNPTEIFFAELVSQCDTLWEGKPIETLEMPGGKKEAAGWQSTHPTADLSDRSKEACQPPKGAAEPVDEQSGCSSSGKAKTVSALRTRTNVRDAEGKDTSNRCLKALKERSVSTAKDPGNTGFTSQTGSAD